MSNIPPLPDGRGSVLNRARQQAAPKARIKARKTAFSGGLDDNVCSEARSMESE